MQKGDIPSGIVREGRGWCSPVPTKPSWHVKPGRTGRTAGGLAHQVNRGASPAMWVWHGEEQDVCLFPPALVSQVEGI